MIYTASITTTAGGSKQAATRTIIKVTKGLIWNMEVFFPPGCTGLTHVQFFDGSYQILPASPGNTLIGDGQLLRYDDLYLKEAAPFELVIVSWNEDTFYDHTIQIRIGMASARLFMARYMPSLGWEDFTRQMDQARTDQEKNKEAQAREVLKELGYK